MTGSPGVEAEIIRRAYAAFNVRDIDGALALFAPDVEWPNGMEGGVVRGREAVRAYWSGQWRQVDPTVQPLAITPDERGRQVVAVHQVVRDLAGNVLLDRTVHHVYELKDGLVTRMEIRDQAGAPLPRGVPADRDALQPGCP